MSVVVGLVVLAVAGVCHLAGFLRGWDHGETWAKVRLADLEAENLRLRQQAARDRHPAGRGLRVVR